MELFATIVFTSIVWIFIGVMVVKVVTSDLNACHNEEMKELKDAFQLKQVECLMQKHIIRQMHAKDLKRMKTEVSDDAQGEILSSSGPITKDNAAADQKNNDQSK